MKPPYCEINGLICTDVVSSVDLKGADLKLSDQAISGRRTGEITDGGRNPRVIQVNARFLTEADLDDFIAHVNSAPEDFEAYPFRDDRCAYIAKAHAQVYDPQAAGINGEWTTHFRAKAMLHTREPWMYGIEKGIRYESPQALPLTVSLEHEGTVEKLAALDKLCVRGQYVAGSGYIEDLTLSVTPTGGSARDLLLCSKLMRDDLFEVDRFGSVLHSYENDFDCTFGALQADLQGATYAAYCTITDEKLTISGEGRCIFPFFGPLPISALRPYLDLEISAIGANAPKLVAGVLSDLSDLAEVDVDLCVGSKRVYIPGYEGQGDFFVGFIPRRCWITGPDMATARAYTSGGGGVSSAICMGGYATWPTYSVVTEEFNGTAWSAGGDLTTGRRALAGGGDATNAICMGGYTAATWYSKATEEYNGTSWSNGGDLATGRNYPAGDGSASGAICVGGKSTDASPYYTTSTEEYNGTSWGAGGAIMYAKTSASVGGNASDAFCTGGHDSSVIYERCETYNGTAWYEVGSLRQARSLLAAGGNSSGGMCMGGDTNQAVATTEEFDGDTWIVGGSMITARYGLAGGVNASGPTGICIGGLGLDAAFSAKTELYGPYSTIELESIKAVVHRCVDPVTLPTVDPGDTFELKMDGDGAAELAYLELYFRDAWWF